MKRNILTIFLASPGDLREERTIAAETVSRVNKVLSRRVGWTIELLGWEDTLPGGSRPQELINKDVDACELFLGILWRRWGEDTGKYSSGFEEEFTRVQERRKKSGSPEIWQYFKKVDEESAKDPGDQLKRVLKFREEQTKNKELMFKEFKDSEEWAKIIYDDLLQYVLDLSINEAERESRDEALLAGQPREILAEPKIEEFAENYPPELLTLLTSVNTKLKEGKTSEIDTPQRLRLYLQSIAWFSEGHFGEVFGNHESNLVYLYRKEWKLSASETGFLVRSFISDNQGNRPGWFWIKDWTEEQINNFFLDIATNDLNIDVRRAALSLLSDTGFKAPRSILEIGLNEIDKQVVLETIRLLRNDNDASNLDLLDKLINSEDTNIRDAAITARVDMLYLSKPNKAFSYLIQMGSQITPFLKKTLTDLSLKVDKKLLLDAMKEAPASVRRFSAEYLRKSNFLSKELCHQLLQDPDPIVRREGLLQLIDLGDKIEMDFVVKLFPEAEKDKAVSLLGHALYSVRAIDFRPLLLRKKKPSELLGQLDFYFGDADAYRILAEDHFDLIKARIRSDLDDSFETFRKESDARFKAKGGILEQLTTTQNLIDFTRDSYIAAAIDGLAKNGQRDDVKYARRYLGKTQYKMADTGAIILLLKFGDPSDVDSLIETGLRNYGQTRELAIDAAYNLATDKDSLLERLINNEEKSIAKKAIQILAKHKSGNKRKLLLKLLRSESDSTRIEALSIIAEYFEYNRTELEHLLDVYISQRTYYYNVVTWIDRYLYTKGRFFDYFKSMLSNLIQD